MSRSPIAVGARVERDESGARTATLRLPFLTARLAVAPPPGTGRIKLGPVNVPTPGRTAYYVGLGTLAAVEMIEWPVALAIAAGTYVAEHAGLARRRAAAPVVEAPRTAGGPEPAAGVGFEVSATGIPSPLPRALLRRFRHEEHGAGHHGNGHGGGRRAAGAHAQNGHRTRAAG